jgi:hypothetical protein
MTTKTMSPKVEQRFRTNASATRRPLVDNMLVESEGFTQMTVLEEDSKAAGALIIEGLVGRYGVPTANKRFYGETIMRREVKRLQERINSRSLLAAVDHPTDGKSRIREAGAICVGLRVESDGRVIGKYEVVEESDGGRNLAAFLRRGASIGMSSRGLGSTRLNEHGHHVVGEDFKLHGFDFVADPACRDAYPALVSEDIDAADVDEDQLRATFGSIIEQIEDRARQAGAEIAEEGARDRVEEEFKQGLDEAGEKLREDIKAQVEAEIREQLREDFAVKLVKALQEQRNEVREIVKSELLSDPSVAGAKRFMEDLARKLVPYQPTPDQQVVMDDYEAQLKALRESVDQSSAALTMKDSVIQEIQDQQVETSKQARGLGFRLFVERALINSGNGNVDQLREMIGDPTQFESGETLRDHVNAVIRQVEDAHNQAQTKANNRIKLKEHKADLAHKQVKLQSEELLHLKDEMERKIDGLSRRMNSQIREKDGVIAEAADHIERLERELRQANQVASEADLFSYTVRRTAGHPRGDDILSLVESGKVTSKDEVHRLSEQWDMQASEPGGVSERIRASLGRGRERPSEAEIRRTQQLTEDQRSVFGDMNTTMAEMRALSGIGSDFISRRAF